MSKTDTTTNGTPVPPAAKTVTLKSNDDQTFVVEEDAARISQTIKNIIDDGFAENQIPLANVTGNILAKVVQYCKRHAESERTREDWFSGEDDGIKAFDKDFVTVDQSTLSDIILAANYLEIKTLLDLCCQCVADMTKGKSPEELCKQFNIVNDYTAEDEEEVRRENSWAFEWSRTQVANN